MVCTRFLSMTMGFLLGLSVAVGLLLVAFDAAGARPIERMDWLLFILTAVVGVVLASTIAAIDDKHPCPCPKGLDEEKDERQV